MNLLKECIQLFSVKNGDDVSTLLEDGRYMRVLFTDGRNGERSIGEFYFTPDDTTIQFRVSTTSLAGVGKPLSILFPSSTSNYDRCEAIRKHCRYLKVPVLRNRKRLLTFFESDYDLFGPQLRPFVSPAELSNSEIDR